MKPIKVGFLGLGVVACGTVNALKQNAREISRRVGREILIQAAVVKDLDKPRDCDITFDVFDDYTAVTDSPDIDIVVELMGGTDAACAAVSRAIANGKHVVTANKALVAMHGNSLFKQANEKGLMIAFEAAVAGGIPIIKAIREGLAGNQVHQIVGIINGTANYILSNMFSRRADFQTMLGEAQEKGFAEADPSFDIDGIDAAHKATILTAIAFGVPLQFDKVMVEGIRDIDVQDMAYAEQLGYVIKHLAIAKKTDSGIELRATPALIPLSHTLAHVNGVMNAVLVHSFPVGDTLYYGAGAGAYPTASAVVADIVEVARALTADPNNRVPHLAFQENSLEDLPLLPGEATRTAYYLRMLALDKPGVLAEITRILGSLDISIESILQKEKDCQGGKVPVVIVTQVVKEKNILKAIEKISQLDDIEGDIVRIRLENLT